MTEQELREFEENIVKGANMAFQRLVIEKKRENGELVFSRNGEEIGRSYLVFGQSVEEKGGLFQWIADHLGLASARTLAWMGLVEE